MRGGTMLALLIAMSLGFQSTRPMRGGTLRSPLRHRLLPISIHPPRAGRDKLSAAALCSWVNFNPPAPCGAGPALPFAPFPRRPFQSTRPVRGGTRMVPGITYTRKFQSTRPVRGGTGGLPGHDQPCAISIHPPHAGRDHRETVSRSNRCISIHPPRAGRDANIVGKSL